VPAIANTGVLPPLARIEGESETAYAAFMAYFNLGPDRTHVEAYRQSTGKTHVKQAPGGWNEWVRRFRWDERIFAQEQWEAEIRAEGAKAALKQEGRTWVKRRAEQMERDFADAQLIRERALAIFRFPTAEVTIDSDRQVGDDGTVHVTRTVYRPVNATDMKKAAEMMVTAQAIAWATFGRALPNYNPGSAEPAAPEDERAAAFERARLELSAWQAEQMKLLQNFSSSAPTPDTPVSATG
jgi:hypothetical protein